MKIIINGYVSDDLCHGYEELWVEKRSVYTQAEMYSLDHHWYDIVPHPDSLMIWASYKFKDRVQYVEFEKMDDFFIWVKQAVDVGGHAITLRPSKVNPGYWECEW